MKHMLIYGLVAGGAVVVGAGAAFFFLTHPKEVFNVHLATPGPVNAADAASIAKKFGLFGKFGAKLATKAQLAAAQKAGAGWCFPGWVAEADGVTVSVAQFPTQALPIDPATNAPVTNCGTANTVNTCIAANCNPGVTVYGKKPRESAAPVAGYVIAPWNSAQWKK